MIQLNLLPDIKLEYIKAAKLKRTVIAISIIASIAVIMGISLMAFYTYVVRKGHLNNLSKDVTSRTSDLSGTEDINKILTIQNQLDTLPGLHDAKPNVSAIFGYLSQITPEGNVLNQLTVNMTETTIEITGEANSFANVNEFVDTIKFTNMTVDADSEAQDAVTEEKRAFSEVVLEGFSIEEKIVPFTIILKFDPLIFSNTQKVELIVPERLSTRSETNKPLFQAPALETGEQQ